MKLLALVGLGALIACASSPVDQLDKTRLDLTPLSEMREEFAQMKLVISAMKAEMKKDMQLETEINEMKAEIAEMKALRNTTTAGKLTGAPCALLTWLK
jgi:hypothetical protein